VDGPAGVKSRQVLVDRLARSRALRGSGSEDWTVERNVADSGTHEPALSVIVTLYNYAQYIATCLGSVLQSQPVPGGFEIVVVDDASVDSSADCVRGLMAEAAVPIRLVRKRTNTGPADSRNIGIRLARASRIFILDADNWIYPQCLAVLFAALDGSVAASYGLIRRFDDETDESLGLLSAFAWDVHRLVARPYIDAMAMFERDALEAAGCYSTELIEHGWFGWEDYDLWLKLAGAGKTASHVPRVLSAYRVHPAAMLRRTDATSANIAAYFHEKFQDMVARHPGLDSYFGFPATEPAPAGPPAGDPQLLGSQRRCRDLENELAAVYASKSWRAGAPVRALFNLFLKKP
jgi:GT2 family glycosyltransferase